MPAYPPQRAVFRQYFSIVPIVGVNYEFTNPAASGKSMQIRRVKFYSLLANQAKLTRNTAAIGDGTPGAATPTRARTDTAPVVTVKNYTGAAPTAGAGATNWDIMENIATQTTADGPLSDAEPGLVIVPGEFAELLFTVATQSEGYVEWAEDPA